MLPPIVGIAPDVTEPRPGRPRIEVSLAYAQAVREAGGFPVILAPIVEAIPEYLALCQAFLLTGGDDPRTEPFGTPTHAKASPMHPDRQRYDVALLEALRARPDVPALGVCLGMQLMSLVAGGTLDQHLPETLDSHADHWANGVHAIVAEPGAASPITIPPGPVTSHHRQAVSDPGSLKVLARSTDGVIEAVCRPDAKFFVGVQWHPERTENQALGIGLFRALIKAAREG